MRIPLRLGALLIALPVLLSLFAGAALAHEVRPAYLELVELDPQTWDVLWKVPARDGRSLGLGVEFPAHCRSTAPHGRFTEGAYIERWKTRCDTSLYGSTITITGLESTRTDVLVRLLRSDETSQTRRLTPTNAAFAVSDAASWTQIAATYLPLGMEHILLGTDHLLFVLALLFLVRSWPRLIATVTAFTIAHSITLAAATLGWIRIPQTPVEAVIALSIVFVAVEIVHARSGKISLAITRPWTVAFVFGLLHGIGFSGALRETGLPENAIPSALAFFNIGVELGQLSFILAVFVALNVVRSLVHKTTARRLDNSWQAAQLASTPVAYLIGTLAVIWVLERTAAFWQ